MKKVFLLLLTVLFVSCSSVPVSKKSENLIPIKNYEVEQKVYDFSFNNFKRKTCLTYDEAEKAVDNINWLLRSIAVNYDEALERGYDSETVKDCILINFDKDTAFSTDEFILAVRNVLLDYFNDYHLAFWGNGDWRVPVCVPYMLFYSNIYVEKNNNKFFVVQSDNDSVLIGDEYFGSEENLFYYPAKGENVYRYGTMIEDEYFTDRKWTTNDWISCKKEKFGNKEVEITCKYDRPLERRATLRVGEIETENSAYVSISTFGDEVINSIYRKGTDKNFEKWYEAAVKFHDKENLIIDLRSNGGGTFRNEDLFMEGLYTNKNGAETFRNKTINTTYENKINELQSENYITESEAFLWYQENLYRDYNIKADEYKKMIYSKLKQYSKNPVKNYYKSIDYMIYNFGAEENTVTEVEPYTGNIYFIVDSYTCSAAEEIIAKAKYLFGDKVKIIGQNSRGCISYGNVYTFPVRNAGVSLTMCLEAYYPEMEKIENWMGEGRGFYPDYWCAYDDLQETIRVIVKDEQMADRLQYIGYALQ